MKFGRFLYPLVSNVMMSHRPYPATVFTFVNFSGAEMSRFIVLSKNFLHLLVHISLVTSFFSPFFLRKISLDLTSAANPPLFFAEEEWS